MKRILMVILVLFVLSVPVSTIFSADYFLFDRETDKILSMGAKDTQFMEKIDMEKNPNVLMPTYDPDKYLAIFAPEVIKGKEKDAQKGELILFNINTGKAEDLVELGYGPFGWAYSDDRKQFFITYHSELSTEVLDLLHYNIEAKTSETMAGFAKKINDLVVSADGTRLYALLPGDDKDKDKAPGEVQVVSYSPLTVEKTLPMDVNPQALFILSSEKFVVVDADEKNHKKSGDIKVFNSADCSISDDFKFDAPYKIWNVWYKDHKTLLTMVNAPDKKSFACKINGDGIKTTNVPSDWIQAILYKDSEKDKLLIFTYSKFVTNDYTRDKLSECKTDANSAFYNLNYIPETNMVVLFPTQGGKVKFIDLNSSEPQMVKSAAFGRASAKFGNFMANLIVNVALTSMSYYGSYNYGYYNIYSVNFFRSGAFVAAAPNNSKYYVLRRDTRDITIFLSTFEKPTYIVPKEAPLTMFQLKKPVPRVLVVSSKRIFLINPEDDSLKEIHVFKEPVSDCAFFEEENRLIIQTNRDLLVLDPATLEVKNDFMFWGDPGQKYTKLKKGEQRYYFIPEM